MLRKLMLFAMLAAAAPLATGEALAATKEELKAEKAEVKYTKSVAKSVDKLAKKWGKNADKGKDNGDVEKELKTYYRSELAFLKEKGVKLVEEPEPMHHPKHPPKVLPEPETERPKLEELRDIVVDLRSGDLKEKRYRSRLADYTAHLWERYERKNARYTANKKSK